VGTPFPLLTSFRTHGNGVSTVKVFTNSLWTALRTRTIFRQKCKMIAGFYRYNLNFSVGNTPRPRQNAPRCVDQTPISAWLTRVPIVTVLRNDHCSNPNRNQNPTTKQHAVVSIQLDMQSHVLRIERNLYETLLLLRFYCTFWCHCQSAQHKITNYLLRQ